MSEECTCEAGEVILLPCSGGSNCGQIANRVAVSLDLLGAGRLYCLAGIGAHIDGMVESAKAAKKLVAIDGCPTACARKTVEHSGLKVTDWVCITDEGVTKSHSLLLDEEQVEPITWKVKGLLAKPLGASST